MSGQMPPWLQEQVKQYQQTQNNLQAIAAQQQQLEVARINTERALEELQKAADNETVYKQVGPILIKTEKPDLISDLEENLELAKTQTAVVAKQRDRLKKTLQEQDAKIQAALRGGAASPPSGT